jgi:hypothetical protein
MILYKLGLGEEPEEGCVITVEGCALMILNFIKKRSLNVALASIRILTAFIVTEPSYEMLDIFKFAYRCIVCGKLVLDAFVEMLTFIRLPLVIREFANILMRVIHGHPHLQEPSLQKQLYAGRNDRQLL